MFGQILTRPVLALDARRKCYQMFTGKKWNIMPPVCTIFSVVLV